jgi:hypothetical protein
MYDLSFSITWYRRIISKNLTLEKIKKQKKCVFIKNFT